MTDTVNIPVGALVAAARELALAGRWERAAGLLAEAPGADPRIALAAAEVAVERDWHTGSATAADALAGITADDDAGRWDLAFLRLRADYRERLWQPDAGIRRRAAELRDSAPDELRRGWAEMYLGLVADNLFGERDAAPAHYAAALRAAGGDGLLRREALRHLGDHDHDGGDHDRALERWREATAAGAAAGTVPGTLSQQLLLAVLARDAGDEAGAAALATEVARWAAAIGAARIADQAREFLDGTDPTSDPRQDTPER